MGGREENRLKAYEQGVAARRGGRAIDANPFTQPEDQELYAAWEQGWLDENEAMAEGGK
jgi:hypothetical protein